MIECINSKRSSNSKDWSRKKESSHWKLVKESCFNSSVKKRKAKSSWNSKLLLIMMLRWKLLIFLDFNNCSKVGLKGSISIFLLNSSENILSMLKTWKVLWFLLGNFWYKLLNYSVFQRTTWKKKVIGKIGLRKFNKTLELLN